jgi:ketosteroid isomerase-like protein
MYRMIVAAQVRKAWRHMQRGDWQYVLDGFADDFRYEFAGDHALGGVRTTRASQAEWFARLFRLVGDAEFTLKGVAVSGWPSRTRALTELEVRLPSKPDYRNDVFQSIEIRWGKITRVLTLEDTQKLAGVLAERAAEGVEEAAAPPISDE